MVPILKRRVEVMMKAHIWHMLVCSLVIFYSCENTDYADNEFSFVLCEEPVVNEDHVIIKGSTHNIQHSDSARYGFVWSGEVNPTVGDFIYIYEKALLPETFTFTIYSGMMEGKTYFVRAFTMTDSDLMYSNQVSFESKGGREVEIDSIFPLKGGPGTVVTINGKYFPLNENKVKVLLGETEAVLDTITENTLKLVIPNITKSIHLPVTIVSENGTVSSEGTFHVTYPFSKIELFSLSPFQGDGIISGNKFFSATSGSDVIYQYHPLQLSLLNTVPTPEVITWDFKFALEPAKNMVAAIFSDKLYEFNMVDDSWAYLTQLPDTGYQDFIFYNSQKICVGNIKSRKIYIYDLASQIWKNPVQIPQNLGTYSPGPYYNTEAAGYVHIRMNDEGTIAIFDLKNEEWQPKDDLIGSDVHVSNIISTNGALFFVARKKSSHSRYSKELRILNEADYTWEKTIALPFDHYEQVFEYKKRLYFLNSYERLLWEYDPELH